MVSPSEPTVSSNFHPFFFLPFFYLFFSLFQFFFSSMYDRHHPGQHSFCYLYLNTSMVYLIHTICIIHGLITLNKWKTKKARIMKKIFQHYFFILRLSFKFFCFFIIINRLFKIFIIIFIILYTI